MTMTDILGSNPLMHTMNQQGIPLSVLAQITPSANNFRPDLQGIPFPPMPNKKVMASMGPLQQPAQQAPQLPQQGQATPQMAPSGPQSPGTQQMTPTGNPESDRIVKALIDRLDANTKLQNNTVYG